MCFHFHRDKIMTVILPMVRLYILIKNFTVFRSKHAERKQVRVRISRLLLSHLIETVLVLTGCSLRNTLRSVFILKIKRLLLAL